jgi:pyridoxamine 5'-phosphate oxidase family protein
VQQNPRAAFVVDDVVSVQPWIVRGIDIRGSIKIVPMGGSALGPGFDAEMFRLCPMRIVSWGIEGTMMEQNARSVG